jgi:hypothetical protein
LLWIVVAALATTACGATTNESSVGPGGPKCDLTLTAPAAPVRASGDTGTISIVTTPECEWTAASEAAWITGVTPSQGQGNGQVQFQAAANPDGTARDGTINVNNKRALVRQDGSPCGLTATASPSGFAAPGGSGTIAISALGGCSWTAESNASWLTLSSSSGSGSASVAFTVAANTGPARAGTITAGDVVLTISQASPSCTISLQQSSASMPAAGGSGTIAVTAPSGCAWTANSSAIWITLTTAPSGSGNGSVGFTVAANTSTTARSSSVSISGVTFTVNQAGAPAPCTYTINPTSQSIGAGGGAGSTIAVTSGNGCAWTAVSNAPWLTVTTGASGSGNGNVTFTVGANTGAQRIGTLTVATQTFTVTQAAGAPACTYSINPTSITVGDRQVTGLTVAVTAPGGCTWTAVENASWLDITSGSSGSGNGTVTYQTSNFGGSQRVGTMTIAGQTFTVTQVECSATLNPQTQSVTALGGAFTVSVTTQIGCQWQAVESLSWVSITGGSPGTGNGTVSYTVSPNLGGARNGTVAIAGRTLTINQAAVP